VWLAWFDVNTTDNPVADTAFFLGRANDFAITTMTKTRSATSTSHIPQ
jgi:hypothetical protein